MWLLSTDRAELHFFARNFDVVGGYAILSHTWEEDGEQTFQQVCAIQERCRANRTSPRDDPGLSPKIRNCCILAERHGYRWVWIDSCCIDKTSSSELSEAINSMYKWYCSSEVCYAYLKDVPSDDILQSPNSAFWKSRWHTRGWTLQELIAPDSVIFLSLDWRELGNRAELALLLQMITQLPIKLMIGVTRPAEYSACIRMSWASQRKTTRIEDEAYCLMGLFDVSMPTNYGEGKRAFIRLQHEIMQHKECDMSLFAFGEPIMRREIIRHGMVFEGDNEHIDRDNPWQYLLADSPRQFRNTFGYIPHLGSDALQQYPPQDSTIAGPFDHVELPHATSTSYGVKFRLPIATIDNITLAVILCEAGKQHFGLFLTRDDRAKDPQRPRYFVGRGYTRAATGSATYLARMCDLGGDLYNLLFNGKRVTASWSTIYLVRTASDVDSASATSPNLLINCHPRSRFQLPRWLVDRFIEIQFEVDQAAYSDTLQIVRIVHRSAGRIYMCLGTCTEHHGGPEDKPPLWAKVFVAALVSPKEFPHDCSQDHLDSESWAARSRTFGDADRTVQLSFTQSRRRLPETFVLVHLELSGHVFEESVLKGAGISFPSVSELEMDPPCPIPDTLASGLEPRRPWRQVGAFDSDSPRHTPFTRLMMELQSKGFNKDPPDAISDASSIIQSQPCSPSPQFKSVTPENSSLRLAPTTPSRTPFARMRRLFSKRRLRTGPAQGSSTSVPSESAGAP